ncbi:MAG TPA: hypothetical protein VLU25_19885 [Acidobacteriota bacterium]|nr:hypothetical protein [Acidobacteriota bacterium]
MSRLTNTSLGLLVLVSTISVVVGQPTFNKTFNPDTIGPGTNSRLRFEIANDSGSPVENLAFTDILPAGLTITDPTVVSNTCNGTLTAPDGGDTISLSGGTVAGSATCVIEVDVTGSTDGVFMNVSGDLTSDAGNSGNATADLTVSSDRPLFSKSFSPAPIPFGGRSTLTLTIENTTDSFFISLAFTDDLPAGLEVADPANLTNTCGGSLAATPGSTTISLILGSLPGSSTCTIEFDVVAGAAGRLINSTSPLSANNQINQPRPSGFANAALEVTLDAVNIVKNFTDDPVGAGGTATLEFTIANRDRDFDAVNVTFSDDLDATLSGLEAVGLPAMDVCGVGSMLSGTSTISLTGGLIPAGESCTFSVTLQVPPGAASGEYPNTTSNLTGDLGGGSFSSDGAIDSLFVTNAPVLTKTFLPDTVGAGDTTTIEFTITSSPDASASDITFMDNLTAFLSGAQVTSLPAAGFCGGGSLLQLVSIIGEDFLLLSNGSLAADDSCTFQVDLLIPAGQASGPFVNTTTNIMAETQVVDQPPMSQVGNAASATLNVVAGPRLSKSFTDDPVSPGDTVTLEFTLTHDEFAASDAVNISFSDDLGAALTGLAAVGLPMNDVCGMGSQIAGTGVLSFTGGTLAPAASCTFSVTLQVPAGALPGSFLNTTSDVTADVGGVATISPFASDSLIIGGVDFTKTFTNDPTIPGDTVNLEFTIANNTALDAANISFQDNLNAVITGLAAEGPLPANPCGAGSTIVGTTNLQLSGGDLLAGTSCTFSVTVRVPGGAPEGDFGNTTTPLTLDLGGNPLVLDTALDVLSVSSEMLDLTKTFTDDPVVPGGTVTLEFMLANLNAGSAASGITFTDNLGAALSGLAAIGLPANDICGAGSTISGTSLLTLTGGNLPAGGSCTFSVTLQVPAVASGTTVTNTTSTVSGTINDLPVTGSEASDNLMISVLNFSKSFSGPSVAGGMVTLSFTIENVSTDTTASGLAFTDDLNAVLAGLAAAGLPASNVCGAGSQISGATFLTFSGGTLAPMASCNFDIVLQVPAGAFPGTFPNTTSDLFLSGVEAADPATDSLSVEPPPLFSKSFAPDPIALGGVSTLTFVIDNTASALAASALDFTDNLPAGLVVASPSNASTTCTGGALTAVSGAGVISYSGGTVAASSSCTVQADVASQVSGSFVNTSGDLTSSSGNSGPASDSLRVNPPPAFSKAFAPDTIPQDTVSTLTFTIDNTASTVAATGLAFTDNLPAAVTVANPPNASTTCTGGTLTAASGANQVSYSGGTVAASSSCTIQVDVSGNSQGMHVNTTGNLTSSLGNSGTASDTLTVNAPTIFTKRFSTGTVVVGQVFTLTFTIDNSSSTVAATGLNFVDNLPAGMTVADPANASNTCTGGTLTANPGESQISYSGGSVAAMSICGIEVDVVASSAGDLTNTTEELSSSLGNSGAASAQVEVIRGRDMQEIPILGTWGLLGLAGLLLALGWGRLARR